MEHDGHDLQPSVHQAAGHKGCLTMEDGLLFVKPTVQQEVDFYAQVQAADSAEEENEDDLPGSKLVDWIPLCMGTLTQGDVTQNATKNEPTTGQKEYVVLQNLYHGFHRPSILDIKLGSKLTDDEVTPQEKIDRLQNVSNTTTSGSLGFRICGMKLYNGSSKNDLCKEVYAGAKETMFIVEDKDDSEASYIEFNKMFGRTLTKENVADAIHQYLAHYFFQDEHFPKNEKVKHLIVIRLLEIFVARLLLLYNCLSEYEVRIFSGSLLFIFENDLEQWGLDSNVEKLSDDNLLISDEVYETFDPLIRGPLFDDDMDDEEEDGEKDLTNTQSVAKNEELETKNESLDAISKEVEIEDIDVEDIDVDDLDELLQEDPTPLSSLNLIDFAHAKFVKGQGPDTNILSGIQNLIDIFDSLLTEEKKRV